MSTHCNRGHLFTDKKDKRGKRNCQVCLYLNYASYFNLREVAIVLEAADRSFTDVAFHFGVPASKITKWIVAQPPQVKEYLAQFRYRGKPGYAKPFIPFADFFPPTLVDSSLPIGANVPLSQYNPSLK